MDIPEFLKDKSIQLLPNGCWEWLLTMRKGYGDAGGVKAYRFVYEMLIRPVKKGLELHHVCRNKRCVNPCHLMPVTKADHQRIHIFCGEKFVPVFKTHCKRGHEFNEQNTRYSFIRGGKVRKSCRLCAQKYFEVRRANERILDGRPPARPNGQRTHCPHGHEYTLENTYWTRRPGVTWKSRTCRTCCRTRYHLRAKGLQNVG